MFFSCEVRPRARRSGLCEYVRYETLRGDCLVPGVGAVDCRSRGHGVLFEAVRVDAAGSEQEGLARRGPSA